VTESDCVTFALTRLAYHRRQKNQHFYLVHKIVSLENGHGNCSQFHIEKLFQEKACGKDTQLPEFQKY